MTRRSDPGQVSAAVRRQRILELRTLGRTLEQIGQDVGLAKSNVKHQLDKALDELAAHQLEATARYRALAYARLERLLARAMLLGANGNLKAMAQAQKLIQAQARLLGWEAPQKHAFTDPSGDTERPPGLWVLPAPPPDLDIETWQRQAEAVLLAQEQRVAAANAQAAPEGATPPGAP